MVARLVPPHCAVEPGTKPEPFTINVKGEPPSRLEDGDKDEIAGAGLSIVKETAEDDPPPGEGLLIVTLAVPAAAISVVGMLAVSRVAET